MFVKAFRLRNLLYGLAAVGIAAAIVGNLAAMGVRALNRPEGVQMEPSAAETIEKKPEAGEKVVYRCHHGAGEGAVSADHRRGARPGDPLLFPSVWGDLRKRRRLLKGF